MKKRRFAAMFLVLVMCIGLLGGTIVSRADDLFVDVANGTSKIIEVTPGKITHVKLPIKALISYISSPTITGSVSDNSPFTVSNVKMTKDNIEGDVLGLAMGEAAYAEFDIDMKDTAKIGNYDMSLKFSYTSFSYEDYNESNGTYATKTCSIPLVVRVSKEKAPAQISLDNTTYDKDAAAIGNTFNLTFDIKNEGEIKALNTYFSVNYGETGLVPAYSVENQKVGDLANGDSKKVSIPISVLPTATEGFKTITVNFSYKDADGTEKTASKNIYITVQKVSVVSSEDAKLIITSNEYEEDVKAGTNYTLNAQIENVGEQTAKDVKVSISAGTGLETGIIEDYENQVIELGELVSGNKTKIELPLLITKSVTEGLKELTLQVTYTDSEKVSRTAVTKVYLSIGAMPTLTPTATPTPTPTPTPEEELLSEIVMYNVIQSPSNPNVGEVITVTFNIMNNGNNTATDIKVMGDGLSSAGFEPVSSDPFKSIGTLKPGDKKQITMKFKAGDGIPEGTNPLKLICDYKDAKSKAQQNTVTFYILNVRNDSNSKPKLIINDFKTDKEELQASSTFKLTFDLKNTHTSKTAKNIKITVSQKDNVFSAAEGSNTLYIDRINAQETISSTIELKVKNDAATGAYDVDILIEYEYDNMSKVDAEAGGVKETNTIKLQAVENARPVVQNVSVGMYDAPMVGTETTLIFDFYNMGKSTLNNVYFTLEGDFSLASGTMSFLGSVTAGGYEQQEIAVMPNKEGTCSGKIIIHFEDSNGNEVTKEQEFADVYVQAAYDPGNDMNIGGDLNIPTDVLPKETAKPIVPLWLFLVIQGGILIVFIPIVRILVIRKHKKKLLKEDSI